MTERNIERSSSSRIMSGPRLLILDNLKLISSMKSEIISECKDSEKGRNSI